MKELSYEEDWLDLGAGLGLLVDEYSEEIARAMQDFERTGNSDDLEHYTAVAICMLTAKNKLENWMADRWANLCKIKRQMPSTHHPKGDGA